MIVIPSINVSSSKEAKELITKASLFLPADGWIHIDVADGIFTPNVSWGSNLSKSDFNRLAELTSSDDININIEVHLMVSDVAGHLSAWCAAGIQRVIVHAEVLENFEYALEVCAKHGVELGLAIAPETSVEELNVYFNKVHFFQILAVKPGLSGQKFDERAISKIQFLKAHAPHVILEVDGGITSPVVRLVKEAGADIVVSSNYIWKSSNSKEAYQELIHGQSSR